MATSDHIKKGQQILASDIINAFNEKANNTTTLTNAAASSTLPSTAANQTLTSLLQTVRNNLRHLFDNKADNTTTLTDADASNTLPSTTANQTLASLLQTVRNNLRHLFDNKADTNHTHTRANITNFAHDHSSGNGNSIPISSIAYLADQLNALPKINFLNNTNTSATVYLGEYIFCSGDAINAATTWNISSGRYCGIAQGVASINPTNISSLGAFNEMTMSSFTRAMSGSNGYSVFLFARRVS